MAINYQRVNWDTTMYVNPENMNQMDEGIEDACNGVDNLSTSVDERIGDMSTLPHPNDDLSSNITAINSTLDNKIGAKGAKLLSIITATGEQDINISDYAFIIIQLTAYGAAYPIGTQIIFDNCTEVGLGKDNGFTSNYGALLSVSFTNNKINLKSIAGTGAQVRIYGVFPK